MDQLVLAWRFVRKRPGPLQNGGGPRAVGGGEDHSKALSRAGKPQIYYRHVRWFGSRASGPHRQGPVCASRV